VACPFLGEGSLWEIPRLAERAGPPWNDGGTWEFYGWRSVGEKVPTEFGPHLTLAEMENWFEDFTLITQNVDDLHRRAGGGIFRARAFIEGA
jgi:NAD-dependent SIR2 family protein deacetylase